MSRRWADIEFDGYAFECCEESCEDYALCGYKCYVCPDGKNMAELRDAWREELHANAGFSRYVRVLDILDDEQFADLVLSRCVEPNDPYTAFGFAKEYCDIAEGLHAGIDTVIDFGSAVGLQGFLFPNVRYIAVDNYEPAYVGHDMSEFYCEAAQDFIAEHAGEFDQSSTLALCLNVPDEAAREAVLDAFDNRIVIWFGEYL